MRFYGYISRFLMLTFTRLHNLAADATYITTIVQLVQSSALTPRGNYQRTNLIECSSHIRAATNTG